MTVLSPSTLELTFFSKQAAPSATLYHFHHLLSPLETIVNHFICNFSPFSFKNNFCQQSFIRNEVSISNRGKLHCRLKDKKRSTFSSTSLTLPSYIFLFCYFAHSPVEISYRRIINLHFFFRLLIHTCCMLNIQSILPVQVLPQKLHICVIRSESFLFHILLRFAFSFFISVYFCLTHLTLTPSIVQPGIILSHLLIIQQQSLRPSAAYMLLIPAVSRTITSLTLIFQESYSSLLRPVSAITVRDGKDFHLLNFYILLHLPTIFTRAFLIPLACPSWHIVPSGVEPITGLSNSCCSTGSIPVSLPFFLSSHPMSPTQNTCAVLQYRLPTASTVSSKRHALLFTFCRLKSNQCLPDRC